MRLVEYLLLFFGLVGVHIAVHVPGGPIPVLLVAAVAIVFYLRRATGFDRATFWRRGSLRGVLLLWAAVTVLTVAAVAVFDRAHLFDLPRHQPWLWLAICVLYPLVSVYPQELLFRAFLLHRYSPVFGSGRKAAALAAAAHLLFGNVLAVVATILGGWLFARRYQRTQSLLMVSVEHALYGITILTVGLGQYFYHGRFQ
ncbi:CPBP family glutamic-type intramembrane protease [Actinoplanes subtropicus]|uniref:CPBP family glutamic-type intramembrane protease n=1 Tax=Actinoplanes subtropicus TaxID=543632 RepID=UPI0004C3F7B1|nr:CPBP family glutamic-type intramembrane protease [Actinoplanes subtropicus]